MAPRRKTQCVFCGDVPANLSYHLLRHTQEKPFHCQVCKKEFNIEGNLKTHHKTHRQHKRFSNGICKRRFLQKKKDLTQPTIHAKSNEKPRPCPDPHCSYTTKTKSQFVMHLLFHSSQKTFKCALCSEKFVTSGEHEHHLLSSHSGEKAYKCLVCPQSFASLERVMDHLRCRHLGEKVHICRKCGEEFGYAACLSEHKNTCKKYNKHDH